MTDLRVLDIVNTDHAALHFLAYRVGWINRHTEFQNDVICSAGPHLQRLSVPGARVTPLEIPRGMSPQNVMLLFSQLVRHLRANPYTIVHTHNSITGAVGRLAARLARVPLTIHTTHGFHFHEHMGQFRRLPFVTAERWLSRCCDVLLCQNREELDDIRRLGLRPRQGVFHVGNGIDLKVFRPRPALPANPRPVILCVGRLEPVKNHDMLFRALTELRALKPVVWLVGEGPSRARYEADIQRLGLADSVEFLGYRYDVPELTAAADVVVLTSVKEGIPRALMQAAAIGVPAIATNVKGSREVVVDGETGFLVTLDDHAALADRLRTLLESTTLRRDMGVNAVALARRNFDEERVVERLARVYRGALRARGIDTTPVAPEVESAPPARAAGLKAGHGRA